MFTHTVSIDVSSAQRGTDNGYLDNARLCMPCASSHASTEALVNALGTEMLGNASIVCIVGHGYSGSISAGGGMYAAYPSNHIGADRSRDEWMPRFCDLFAAKGPLAGFMLLGCDVGAGASGRDLLVALASSTGSPCMAPTGIICCGPEGFSLEEGADWQYVTPGSRPAAVDVKYRSFSSRDDEPIYATKSHRFFKYDLVRVSISYGDAQVEFEGSRAIAMASNVDFQNGIRTECRPGAMFTGLMEIEFEHIGVREEAKFNIYNDRILEGESTPGILYASSPMFSNVVASLRSGRDNQF